MPPPQPADFETSCLVEVLRQESRQPLARQQISTVQLQLGSTRMHAQCVKSSVPQKTHPRLQCHFCPPGFKGVAFNISSWMTLEAKEERSLAFNPWHRLYSFLLANLITVTAVGVLRTKALFAELQLSDIPLPFLMNQYTRR